MLNVSGSSSNLIGIGTGVTRSPVMRTRLFWRMTGFLFRFYEPSSCSPSVSPQVDLRRGISASVFSTSPCKVNEQKSFLFGGFPERFAREICPTQSLIANVFSMEFSN